jgi:hypothetical protein
MIVKKESNTQYETGVEPSFLLYQIPSPNNGFIAFVIDLSLPYIRLSFVDLCGRQ